MVLSVLLLPVITLPQSIYPVISMMWSVLCPPTITHTSIYLPGYQHGVVSLGVVLLAKPFLEHAQAVGASGCACFEHLVLHTVLAPYSQSSVPRAIKIVFFG